MGELFGRLTLGLGRVGVACLAAVGCSSSTTEMPVMGNPQLGTAGGVAAPAGAGKTAPAGPAAAGGTPVGPARTGAAGARATPGASGAGAAAVGGAPAAAGASAGAGGVRAAGSAGSAGTAATGGSSGSAGSASGPMPKKFVGNITTSGMVRDGFAKYWNQITPENEGKWGSVQPSQGSFNWGPLDKIHAYAKDNGVIFKQHTFVWGSQQPGWVDASNGEMAVKAWMKAYCERYPDVKLIDVVNEPPPHTTPKYMDGIGGAGKSGYDWIVNAFKWAREACPNAILILNDYNNIEYANDNAHTIDIVTKIKAAGAPIDAVGAQAHDAYKIPTATVKGFIDKIASSTGLPVYITEYDIGLADDAQQQKVMQEQITMYWENDNVKGITLWGYIVGATWRANTGLQQPSGMNRPALTWLMEFLGR
jgi:endo-1,4-beta-xylanase